MIGEKGGLDMEEREKNSVEEEEEEEEEEDGKIKLVLLWREEYLPS